MTASVDARAHFFPYPIPCTAFYTRHILSLTAFLASGIRGGRCHFVIPYFKPTIITSLTVTNPNSASNLPVN